MSEKKQLLKSLKSSLNFLIDTILISQETEPLEYSINDITVLSVKRKELIDQLKSERTVDRQLNNLSKFGLIEKRKDKMTREVTILIPLSSLILILYLKNHKFLSLSETKKSMLDDKVKEILGGLTEKVYQVISDANFIDIIDKNSALVYNFTRVMIYEENGYVILTRYLEPFYKNKKRGALFNFDRDLILKLMQVGALAKFNFAAKVGKNIQEEKVARKSKKIISALKSHKDNIGEELKKLSIDGESNIHLFSKLLTFTLFFSLSEEIGLFSSESRIARMIYRSIIKSIDKALTMMTFDLGKNEDIIIRLLNRYLISAGMGDKLDEAITERISSSGYYSEIVLLLNKLKEIMRAKDKYLCKREISNYELLKTILRIVLLSDEIIDKVIKKLE